MLSLFFFLRWSCFGDHKTLLRELVQRGMTGAHAQWRVRAPLAATLSANHKAPRRPPAPSAKYSK